MKTSIITEKGDERIIEFMKPGRFIGAADILVGTFYGITAMAYTDVLVSSFTAGEVKDLLGKDPEFSVNLAKSLSRHAWALGRQILGESFYPASAGRIGYALENLTLQIGIPVGDGEGSNLPITHHDLAKYIGCDRVTVTKALAKLAEDGLIQKKKGTITIPDLDKLRSWLNEIHPM